MRDSVSCGRISRSSRRDKVRSTLSPTLSPTVSFTCLKRSISMVISVGRMASSVRDEDEGVGDAIEEQLAVRQAGEIVVHRVVQDAFLRLARLGHVGERAGDAHDLVVGHR